MPDPMKGGTPEDPSSWNKYNYVQGDPINFADPGGLARCTVVSGFFSNGLEGATSSVQVFCASVGGSVFGWYTVDNFNGDYAGLTKAFEAGEGAQLDKMEFKNRVNSAADLAKSALSRADCAKEIFSNAKTTGPDSPKQLLDDILKADDVIQFYDPDSTINAGIAVLPGQPGDSGVEYAIRINSNANASWNTGFADEYSLARSKGGNTEALQNVYRAMTLVHELAHIWAFKYNTGGDYSTNDRDDTGQQFKNNFNIYMHCFR